MTGMCRTSKIDVMERSAEEWLELAVYSEGRALTVGCFDPSYKNLMARADMFFEAAECRAMIDYQATDSLQEKADTLLDYSQAMDSLD